MKVHLETRDIEAVHNKLHANITVPISNVHQHVRSYHLRLYIVCDNGSFRTSVTVDNFLYLSGEH